MMHNHHDFLSTFSQSEISDLKETIKSSLRLLENTNKTSDYLNEPYPSNFSSQQNEKGELYGNNMNNSYRYNPPQSRTENELKRILELYGGVNERTYNNPEPHSYKQYNINRLANSNYNTTTLNDRQADYRNSDSSSHDFNNIIKELLNLGVSNYSLPTPNNNKLNYRSNEIENSFNYPEEDLHDWSHTECFSLASTNHSESDSVEGDHHHILPKYHQDNSQYISNFLKKLNMQMLDNDSDVSNCTKTHLKENCKLLPSITKRLEKTQLCRHFLRNGKCANGLHCAFAHSLDELRDRPDLSKTRICTDFQMGRCKFGEHCKHAHTEVELRATNEFFKTSLCPDFMRYGVCTRGRSCRYAHGVNELRLRSS